MNTTRELIKGIVITLIIFSTILGIFVALDGVINTYKMRYCEVVDTCNNLVTIEDSNGNLWEYEAIECDIRVGMNCKVIMHNNGTMENIYDDYIVSVKY